MPTPVDQPLFTQHQWPDRDAGPWLVTLTWHTVDGRPECSGFTIAGQVGDVLTSGIIRKLPVAEWIAEDRAGMIDVQPVTGMRKSTRDRLQAAADVYQRALRQGNPPTKAVAEHYGITAGGASNLIARARAAGILPPTSRGVPTG